MSRHGYSPIEFSVVIESLLFGTLFILGAWKAIELIVAFCDWVIKHVRIVP